MAFYGVDQVAAKHCKTSALRDFVIGLVEGEPAMIAGGYLKLLRQGRRRQQISEAAHCDD
jgi:hypothetical protein